MFNVLLQVLDDGRLSDNQGHTVDFTNTIIVMTSNIGSQEIQEITRKVAAKNDPRGGARSVESRFLPEFLNRIDEVIVFHPLDAKHIRKIVQLQVERLRTQIEQAGLLLDVTDAALNAVALIGYDPVYGARPLKRVIQQKLQNRLATEILKGAFPEGSTVHRLPGRRLCLRGSSQARAGRGNIAGMPIRRRCAHHSRQRTCRVGILRINRATRAAPIGDDRDRGVTVPVSCIAVMAIGRAVAPRPAGGDPPHGS